MGTLAFDFWSGTTWRWDRGNELLAANDTVELQGNSTGDDGYLPPITLGSGVASSPRPCRAPQALAGRGLRQVAM
jgi:hypothetical protein